MWPSLRDLSRRVGRPIRVLDLATGGGDIPISLWRKARRDRVPIEIAACDVSQRALEFAGRRTTEAGAAIELFKFDVLTADLPSGFDVVMCSLFLHHLSADDAVRVLGRMRRAAKHCVLVNDLARSTSGLLLAQMAARLLTNSDVVRVDAPLSARAAFTLAEAGDLARRAGLVDCTIARRWPRRYLLSWWADDLP